MSTARRYVLSRVAAGDYLLPSNDGRRLYRLARAEGEGWDVWRFLGPLREWDAGALEDWARWECVAQLLASRAEAIAEALRLS